MECCGRVNLNLFKKKGGVMNSLIKRKGLIFLIGIFLLNLVILTHASDLKIKVIVDKANVRLKPSLDSIIIGEIKKDDVFEVVKKIEEWYLINLPADEKGFVVSGYVHQSVVEEIREEVAPPPAKPPVSPPLPPQPRVYKPKKQVKRNFFIRANFGYGSKSYSYENNWQFTEYRENGSVNEKYDIDASGIIVEGAFGIYIMSNIGLEFSFNPSTGKTKGTFSAKFPHPFYFNQHREKSWEKEDLKYSASELNLNLIFNFPVGEMLNIYFSGGGTYFMNVKAENLKLINWSEIGYPYNDVNMSPDYADYSKSGFGFNAGGGFDFFLMENIALNLNVRYSTGTLKLDVEGTEVELRPGGLRATAGLKFTF
jgi:opacity protein-like surface antigen